MKGNIRKAIIKSLESVNVCQRCILRFLKVRTYTAYGCKTQVLEVLNFLEKDASDFTSQSELPDSDESSVEVKIPPAKRYHLTCCPTCLGILQDECDSIVGKIETVVKESGYQFDDFVIQLSVPVVADLRQYLMFLYLSEQFGSEYGDAEDIPSVKEAWKWVVGSLLGKNVKAEFSPQSDFQISITITYPESSKECEKLLKLCPDAFPNRKSSKAKPDDVFNRTSVQKAMSILSSQLSKIYNLPPETPSKPCEYGSISCSHSPLYLGGRYNKYSRELSQTPWIVDGARKMESSVQELISDIVARWIIADKIIFSASGREDVDVKMLGIGRPFVLEIVNPRRSAWTWEEIKVIESEINSNTQLIAVRDLQVVSKKDTLHLKEGEEMKRKTYTALCLVKKELKVVDLEKLKSFNDLVLNQKTPIRVLHRRPLATRQKVIHTMEGEIINKHQLKLKVETQAGTYVKEFVHSDFGRTIPSLGMLLKTEADIIELDVESVDLDWPPIIS